MNKKILISMIVFVLFFMFCYSYAANDTMANIKNSAENTASSIGSTFLDAKNTMVESGKNIINSNMTNPSNSNLNDSITSTSSYTATRTANNNLLGLTTTTWTWFIMGIVGIIIIALVWYYSMQFEHTDYNKL